jgi:hypothetical protein
MFQNRVKVDKDFLKKWAQVRQEQASKAVPNAHSLTIALNVLKWQEGQKNRRAK